MLGGHARPRQGVEDRDGPFRDSEDAKTETTFMSYVARRNLNFQPLDNALETSLPAVIKCYATLRDANLTESSYDKVVMWTVGSYDCDDVMCALVRLDRLRFDLEQVGKTARPYRCTSPTRRRVP